MEELTTFVEGFAITNEPNRTAAPHPRYSQYKEKTAKNDQNSRRKQLLEVQKMRRFDFLNHVRKLTDNDWCSEGDKDEENEENDQSMEVEITHSKPGRNYKNQLMLSEWLVEVPSDFETEWLTVLCPVAKRCLVVSSRGKTRAFSKSGYCINSFPSLLPGGCRKSSEKNTTILDCLYSEVNQTYYILDLMCWNGYAVYDTETEFRFYWLHDKLSEYSYLGETSAINPYKFVGLPSFSCTQEFISTAITSATFQIDGLLFYHKRTHYIFGSSPLVVWLKPFMLEEILGISVPDTQKLDKPNNYTNYAGHMKMVEEERQKQEKLKEERQRQQRTKEEQQKQGGQVKGRKVKQRNGKRGKQDREMETSNPDSEDVGQELPVDCELEAEPAEAVEIDQPIPVTISSISS